MYEDAGGREAKKVVEDECYLARGQQIQQPSLQQPPRLPSSFQHHLRPPWNPLEDTRLNYVRHHDSFVDYRPPMRPPPPPPPLRPPTEVRTSSSPSKPFSPKKQQELLDLAPWRPVGDYYHQQQLALARAEAAASTTSANSETHPPPSHFHLGSLIQLSNGDLKRVENLTSEDFIRSAKTSPEVKIDHSLIVAMDMTVDRVIITFSVGKDKTQVAVEATLEHPFFAIEKGWSSASPARSLSKFQLPCHQLRVGDVCISLSHCSKVEAAAAERMRPPPPPHELQERRRSNSASPSDKLLLKRGFAAATANSPLASYSSSSSVRPKSATITSSSLLSGLGGSTSGFRSPSKQVAFAEDDEVTTTTRSRAQSSSPIDSKPVKKRKILFASPMSSSTLSSASVASETNNAQQSKYS